ncbi:MAG TPA: SDR family NAD(P)-dependent oxidoreductase, partial [Alphaproteobacteria bacterium]|nr:SDR family NAD(P)-dependent oxidoreductase [Alphaproteobacteria bacterium]
TAVLAQRQGAAVLMKLGDVTDAEGLAAWIKECDQQQPLDLVIANAGISMASGGGDANDEKPRKIFAINVDGTLNTISPAIPLMLQRKRGQIAIMSSLASFIGLAGAPAYSASKAAVRVYGESLRYELASQGVEVNVICPGFIKTPLTDHNHFKMPFLMDVEKAARIIQKGLGVNRGRIAFPWPMYAMTMLLAALPQFALDRIMAILPRKHI